MAIESLTDVDRIVEARKEVSGDSIDQLSESGREYWWTFCKMFGGYVGETIIRNLGGTWFTQENPDGTTVVKLRAADRIEASPPAAIWRNLTEPFRSVATYYRSLRAILGHGATTTEGGITSVKLPPFSPEPPPESAR